MAEPLFGSGPQLWPAIPISSFGYAPAIAGNRGAMIVNPALTEPATPLGASWTAGFSTPITVGPQLAAPFEITAAPQVLLAAVAMRRGQPMGPTNDHEIEDFIADALDLLPGANDVEVRCEGGRTTLSGVVASKRLKRDVGEIVWAIPSVSDVQNNVTIAVRRRSRTSARDADVSAAGGAGRKQT